MFQHLRLAILGLCFVFYPGNVASTPQVTAKPFKYRVSEAENWRAMRSSLWVVPRGGKSKKRSFFSAFIANILALISPNRKDKQRVGGVAALQPSFAACFAESLASHSNDDDQCDIDNDRDSIGDGSSSEAGRDTSGRVVAFPGSFFKALRAAQAEGKPLLVIVVAGEEAGDIYEHPMWKAATDPKSVAMLRQGKVVAWGAWAGSEEMQQVARKVKGVDWSTAPAGLVVLLRPAQFSVGSTSPSSLSSSAAPSVLGTFPPVVGKKMSKAKKSRRSNAAYSSSSSSLVTGARLAAWLSSTLSRYSTELSSDAKLASDRSIVAEISQGLASGLVADREREQKEALALAEALKAKAAAKAAEAIEADDARREKKRRAALKKALGPEPPPAPPATRGKGGGAQAVATTTTTTTTTTTLTTVTTTVAVRLPDGSRKQRRFLAHVHTAGSVLDWLDVEFGLASDSLRIRDASSAPPAAASSSAPAAAGSPVPFGCSGHGDPVAKQTLAFLGFLERPVLLTAELMGD